MSDLKDLKPGDAYEGGIYIGVAEDGINGVALRYSSKPLTYREAVGAREYGWKLASANELIYVLWLARTNHCIHGYPKVYIDPNEFWVASPPSTKLKDGRKVRHMGCNGYGPIMGSSSDLSAGCKRHGVYLKKIPISNNAVGIITAINDMLRRVGIKTKTVVENTITLEYAGVNYTVKLEEVKKRYGLLDTSNTTLEARWIPTVKKHLDLNYMESLK